MPSTAFQNAMSNATLNAMAKTRCKNYEKQHFKFKIGRYNKMKDCEIDTKQRQTQHSLQIR